ncbi:Armadillo-type fold [Pseudocohnilembus persalinus]|uniref:Armadillo-type fold n=1 Tax=Pseudocohnilembus persalinus TaxID=266149 RepID=A0A0V0Q9B2_PSEPJ|nr:Armadillo-type fold [Pseudocohnilembus persalinus]|eukprot:KRW98840.1 Armadillo-type fold [Pseudocohnilembus persalinus]
MQETKQALIKKRDIYRVEIRKKQNQDILNLQRQNILLKKTYTQADKQKSYKQNILFEIQKVKNSEKSDFKIKMTHLIQKYIEDLKQYYTNCEQTESQGIIVFQQLNYIMETDPEILKIITCCSLASDILLMKMVDQFQIFNVLLHFINLKSEVLIQESIFALSNIISTDFSEIIEMFLKSELYIKLEQIFNDSNDKVKREILYVYVNIINYGNQNQLKILLQNNVLKVLENGLYNDDTETLFKVLQGLVLVFDYFLLNDDPMQHYNNNQNIEEESQLQKDSNKVITVQEQQIQYVQNTSTIIQNKLNNTQIIERLQELQYHPNENLYNLIYEIIDEYFQSE